MKNKIQDNVDTSKLNTLPEKHELATANFFANLGKNIEFIKPINIQGFHTPDFLMDGLEWEVKSPIGTNIRSIEDNFRNALKQSPNIIFDLRRSKIWEPKCINKIRNEAKSRRMRLHIKIITKDGRLLTIKTR